jgi:hypothetical protein
MTQGESILTFREKEKQEERNNQLSAILPIKRSYT